MIFCQLLPVFLFFHSFLTSSPLYIFLKMKDFNEIFSFCSFLFLKPNIFSSFCFIFYYCNYYYYFINLMQCVQKPQDILSI
uniref:Uncharacterized protein n=1 Tax=Anguilla anguilla TaxID=7936 RepID=A0A0E9WYP0_ANGAN